MARMNMFSCDDMHTANPDEEPTTANDAGRSAERLHTETGIPLPVRLFTNGNLVYGYALRGK